MNQQLVHTRIEKLILKISVLLFVSFLITSQLPAQVSPRVFINEVLASNLTTNPDMVDFGDFSDWIELYNDETVDVNIGGFYLSDDFTLPTKWQFPANTIISAKGYYLVWADGLDNTPGKSLIREQWPNNIQFTTTWCHTNFKLNKGGDKIGLFNAGGIIVDSLIFLNQTTDVSFGRQPDGTNNLKFFGEPTPMNANSTAGLNSVSISDIVTFSLEGGFYPSSVQLTLTSSAGNGVIRYTTDGSKPTSVSQQYSTLININTNTVVRARLFEDGKVPGRTITNSYFIKEASNLPAISLVTDPTFLWDKQLGIYLNSLKDREIPISLEFFPTNSSRQYFLDAGAKIGGENIFRFAQKPLNIYARSDYGSAHISDKLFDDLPYIEFKQMYLRNGGDDWPNTLMKDGMLQTVLKGRINNPMMAFKPSVLYLNGKYWGIHDIREKIDDQYFLLHYNTDPADLDHLDDLNRIIEGDSTDFVNVLNYANSNNLSDSAAYAYINSKIDVHSLMDFVIVQDYLANTSWGHNREVWRDRKDQKLWQWIIVDLDRGFNTSNISLNQLNDIYNNFGLFRQLLSNTDFKNEFIQRYAQHINHTFDPVRVVNKIDSVKTIIQNEMPRHVQKWGTYIDSLTIDIWGKTPGIGSLTYWNSEVQKLRDFANQRSNYVSQYLSSHFALTGRANLKLTSNLLNEGKVEVNNYLENFGESNAYFKNIPLQVKAYPPPGYGFKQWKELILSTNLNLVAPGAEWRYVDGSSAPTGSWQNIVFDDASWKLGNAQFGYGDGDEKTVITYGPNAQSKYITSYYRKSFLVSDPAEIKELKIKLLRDDGAVVYLNGNEILRSNMPSGTISYSTLASVAVSGTEESTFFEFTIDKTYLVAGTNELAVEIHQAGATSSDVSFDFSLDAILNQQANNATVIGTAPIITYTILDDTELIAEFEKTSTSEIAQVINEPLTLAKANSPYFVPNDVTIEANGVVNIEPGTTIYFSSGKGMTVKGKLIMNGTTADPITLTSYYPSEKWGAICFDNSNGISELNNVNISLATNGTDPVNFFAAISSLNSAVHLNGVHFNNVKLPISSQWSDMTVNSCTFENVYEVGDYLNCNGGNLTVMNSTFIGNAIADMDAIDLGFMAGTTDIQNNTIRDFTGSNSDGIDLGDASINVFISNNLIRNCSDKGVSIGQGSSAFLVRNVIANCNLGVGIKDSLSYGDILNSTFYSNTIGVSCFEKVLNRGGGTADIRNSIIANSKNYSIDADIFSKISVNYSLSNTDTLPGFANIYGEPILINPDGENYHIQTNSLCINNGDPNSPSDNDGSQNDIGAYMYAGITKSVVLINEINYNSSALFDSGDWIELLNSTTGAIDISGYVFLDENRTPSYVIPSGTILQPGSFVVLCGDLTIFAPKYPDVKNVFGNMNSGLSGSGESLFLYNTLGQLVDSLTYNDKAPWPLEADGGGSSLELVNSTLENAFGESWRASVGHGTPGTINSTYVTGLRSDEGAIPSEFSLQQNYPNPFNPETIIAYELPRNSFVTLKVFDILGNEIINLVNGEKAAGRYSISFNLHSGKIADVGGRALSSGIYFYQLSAVSNDGTQNFTAIKKMVLLK